MVIVRCKGSMERRVFINTSFEGIHCWLEAPREVLFLQNPHRHNFNVHVEITVQHNDRELEFIMLKHQINSYLATNFDAQGVWHMGRMSCEDVAEQLIAFLKRNYSNRHFSVSVDEDGENGCTLIDL